MKSKTLGQVLYDMRQQPVTGIVTLIGTALSIFLIMTVMMMSRVNTAEFAPESNRDRLLYGKYINIKSEDGVQNSSAHMTEKLSRRLYDNLDGAVCTSIVRERTEKEIRVQGKPSMVCYVNMTDHNFWNIFDFDFIEGHPFTKDSFEASAKDAVISETLAKTLFGTEDAIGQTILIEQMPFRVTGVVKDVSPLAREAYSEVFISYRGFGSEKECWGGSEYFGSFHAVILAESPESFGRIRADVQSRKQLVNEELKPQGEMIADHGSPFTQEVMLTVRGSNSDPDDSGRRMRLIIYAILLIVPAINLSSMTQGRLVHRISEIGVKRAYGATRPHIIGGIIAENFILTLAGGLVGLILCFVFGYFFSDLVFTGTEISRNTTVPLQMLLDWKLYGSALFFCFILNLLSSGIPAWRASRIDPVRALSGRA